MMRALVLYSTTGRMALLAKALGEGLEIAGYDVQLREADTSASHFSVGQYDLVCVGSPVVGFFGGSIADDIQQMLRRVSRMEGKSAVAFVRSKLMGTTRSLRKLMAEMERQGAMVQDFAALSKPADAERLGKRLENIARR